MCFYHKIDDDGNSNNNNIMNGNLWYEHVLYKLYDKVKFIGLNLVGRYIFYSSTFNILYYSLFSLLSPKRL